MTAEKETTTRLNTEVPADLYKQFRLECVRSGQTVSAVIRELMAKWVEEAKAKQDRS
ncbi:hypothetical protein PQC53_31905 (plasmid) [Pseudomonas aeruginosa]|nr:hypothetical protein PQC53_31905 [Pseudomonas aeruginosa]